MKLPMNLDLNHYVKVILYFAPALSSQQISDLLASEGHIISPASVAGIKSHQISCSGGGAPGENGERVYTHTQWCGSHTLNMEIKCSIEK